MKIILLDKILKLGYVGSKINVKSGYARNYLIPKGLSILNIINNDKNFKKKIILINKYDIKVKNKINKIFLINFYVNCNNKNNLLSSINYRKIINVIKYYNIKIIKKNINNNIKSIKKIGEYTINIKLNNSYYKEILLKIFKKNK